MGSPRAGPGDEAEGSNRACVRMCRVIMSLRQAAYEQWGHL
jgi:hypothetical protein